ncbi:MAG: S8 family serine peptidase [Bacteriovoracaceae bacterium]
MKYLGPLLLLIFSYAHAQDVNSWWYLKNTGEALTPFLNSNIGIDLGVEEVYSSELFKATSENKVLVAVLDSGLDFDHPDFQKSIALNEKDIFNNGVDDDDNGYVDDTYGWNFFDNNFAPNDLNGHGTHVAGIIHRITQGRAEILPVRYSGADGSGNGWYLVQAINYAVLRGAKIINCSWDGALFEQNVYNAMKRAGERGVMFIVAAGNNGTNNDLLPNYPGNFGLENVFVIANMDQSGGLDSYSNYGKLSVDIAAPGDYIMSSKLGGGEVMMDGTSMAAAVATGSMALVKTLYPSLDSYEIKKLMMEFAEPYYKLQTRVKAGGFIKLSNILKRSKAELPIIPDESWIRVEKKIESSHPYGIGSQIFFIDAPAQAKKMRIIFERVDTDPNDQICIKQRLQGTVDCISGKKENYTSTIIEGNKVYIDFDRTYRAGNEHFGFNIKAIEYLEY